MSLLLVVIGEIGQWLLGIGCAGSLLRAAPNGVRKRTIGAEEAGLGLVLGVAATGGLSFLYSLLGGSLGREWSLALTALGWIWGGSALARRWYRADADQDPASNGDPAEGAFVRFCRTAIAILFALAMFQTLLTPQRFWDERATFAIKASVLDLDGTVYSESLSHPDFVQYHPQYPLLIPLAEQHVYALLGEIGDRWSKALFPLLYLGLVLTFAGVLQRYVSAGGSWLFALLLATVPALMPYEYGFLCAQGDAPVACFHGVSLLYLWDALRSRDSPGRSVRSLVIAGLTAAAAAFTKDEGLALLIVDTVALLIVLCLAGLPWDLPDGPTRRGVRQTAVIVSTFCGVAVLSLAPWLWHRGSLPTTTEMNYFDRATPQRILDQFDTLRWSVPHVLRRMLVDVHTWGLQWWLSVAALAIFPRRALRAEQLLLILDGLGALAALLIAGMLSPTEVTEHIGGASHRYLMQLAPAAVLFAAGQFTVSPSSSATHHVR